MAAWRLRVRPSAAGGVGDGEQGTPAIGCPVVELLRHLGIVNLPQPIEIVARPARSLARQ